MGTCQVREPAQFYKIIPKEQEDQFWINRIQINHFTKRVTQQQNKMWAQIKIMEEVQRQKVTQKIKEIEEIFQQEHKNFQKENPRKVKKLKQDGQSVFEISGWTKTQQQIEELKSQTDHRIHTIKDELRSKFKKFFSFIEGELLSKYKHVKFTRYLDQKTVEGLFLQWKSKNKDKIDKATKDLQQQFKKRVSNQEHYRMRWNTVVDEDLFVQVAEAKPFKRNDVIEEGAAANVGLCGFGCGMFR